MRKIVFRHVILMGIALLVVVAGVFAWSNVQVARANLALVAHEAEMIRREDDRRKPVIIEMVAKDWRVVDDLWSASVYGIKSRGECEPHSFPWTGVAMNRVSGEFTLRFLDDDTPGSSRPAGKQSFGVWAFDGDVMVCDEIVITARHLCPGTDGDAYHYGVTTPMGPFVVGDDCKT